MKIHYFMASTLLGLIAMASEASAQYGGHGNHSYQTTKTGSFRAGNNVAWPRAYIPASRRAVFQTYAAMVHNGWRRQNLLGQHHFDPTSNQLNEAGKRKVKWILSQAPVQHRGVFVERGLNKEETVARIAAVHDNAAGLSPAVGPIDVNDTHIVAEGHLGGSVDSTFVGFQANKPLPVLPAKTGSSSE
ncbi:MAG: hypothetical protein MK171_05400 [Pirellulales bacterium]|nr:hypothetical protein [Pirellulales bacterium]